MNDTFGSHYYWVDCIGNLSLALTFSINTFHLFSPFNTALPTVSPHKYVDNYPIAVLYLCHWTNNIIIQVFFFLKLLLPLPLRLPLHLLPLLYYSYTAIKEISKHNCILMKVQIDESIGLWNIYTVKWNFIIVRFPTDFMERFASSY